MVLPVFKFEVAFGYGAGDASPVFTDIGAYGVTQFSTTRGRPYEITTSQPGTMTAKLDNRDGRYTPPGVSPYAGQVKLMVPCRVRVTVSGVTYNMWRGYVERWPTLYADQGTHGWTPLQAVDVLSLLGLPNLKGLLVQECLTDSPSGYWPGSDASGAVSAREVSGSGATAAATVVGKGGTVLPVFGASDVPAGLGGTGVTFAATGANSTATVGAALTAKLATPLGSSFTIEAWATIPNVSNVAAFQQIIGVSSSGAGNGGSYFPIDVTMSTPDVIIGGFPGVSATGAAYFATLHHYVATYSGTAANLYIDGVHIGFSSLGGAVPSGFDTVNVGGDVASGQAGSTSNIAAQISAWAVYPSVLSAARILAHYNAGIVASELISTRIARIFTYAPSAFSSSAAASVSSVGTGVDFAGSSFLTALQSLTTWENGNLFVDKAGTVQFVSRQARYDQTSSVTFGELTGSGEIPYLDLKYDFDPTYVYNDVELTRTNGSGASVKDSTSQTAYGQRTFSATYGTSSDSEIADAADYLLARYKDPHERVETITVDLAVASAATQATILGLEIGNQATVKRRPAFGAATQTASYVIESIAHTVDAAAGSWTVAFEMSPATVNTYWKLQDVVYGQIDQSTILISY